MAVTAEVSFLPVFMNGFHNSYSVYLNAVDELNNVAKF